MKPKPKKNAQDLTLRNSRAVNKKLKAFDKRITDKWDFLDIVLASIHGRLTKLEEKKKTKLGEK